MVESRRERIGVDAERDGARSAERAGDVDALADRGEHDDHDARAYSEESAATSAKVSAVPEPIRILRVIARLNMGGPAIHVSNLAAGLETRGYHTTLVAGSLARGEDSMAFVAERARRVASSSVPEIQREVAPLHDAQSIRRLTAIMREERPHILHTHTAKAGALARAAALAAGACPAADRRPHLPRARAQGLLRPGSHGVLQAGRANARAVRRTCSSR